MLPPYREDTLGLSPVHISKDETNTWAHESHSGDKFESSTLLLQSQRERETTELKEEKLEH
ncbi:hypothetical protein NQZ68_016711 [Dissostichus eleginoides]|nr:hypothetical protein NQZ68_016711 [Dissostichus eleginoides]